jgi:hypothetical protein
MEGPDTFYWEIPKWFGYFTIHNDSQNLKEWDGKEGVVEYLS